MLKFKGTDTSGTFKYHAEGETARELYDELVRKDIISTVDGDPYELAISEKYGKSYEDFKDEDGEINFEEFEKWCYDKKHSLTEDEYICMIEEQTGNAYYQKITEVVTNLKRGKIKNGENNSTKTIRKEKRHHSKNI